MRDHEAGAVMVQHANRDMAKEAGSRSSLEENPETKLLCLQCLDEGLRVCPGSPRRCSGTRLSSGSADHEPSSSSHISSGTFYSCVSQITIGFDLGGQVAIGFSHWNSPFPPSSQNLPSPDCVHSETAVLPPVSENLEMVSCLASLSITPLPTCSQETLCSSSSSTSTGHSSPPT